MISPCFAAVRGTEINERIAKAAAFEEEHAAGTVAGSAQKNGFAVGRQACDWRRAVTALRKVRITGKESLERHGNTVQKSLADKRHRLFKRGGAGGTGEARHPELLAGFLKGANDGAGGVVPFNRVESYLRGGTGNGLSDEQSGEAGRGVDGPFYGGWRQRGARQDGERSDRSLVPDLGGKRDAAGLFRGDSRFAVFDAKIGDRRVDGPLDGGDGAAG